MLATRCAPSIPQLRLATSSNLAVCRSGLARATIVSPPFYVPTRSISRHSAEIRKNFVRKQNFEMERVKETENVHLRGFKTPKLNMEPLAKLVLKADGSVARISSHEDLLAVRQGILGPRPRSLRPELDEKDIQEVAKIVSPPKGKSLWSRLLDFLRTLFPRTWAALLALPTALFTGLSTLRTKGVNSFITQVLPTPQKSSATIRVEAELKGSSGPTAFFLRVNLVLLRLFDAFARRYASLRTPLALQTVKKGALLVTLSVALPIIALDSITCILWQIPSMRPWMEEHFTNASGKPMYTYFLSAIGIRSAGELLATSAVLYTATMSVLPFMTMERFLLLYLTGTAAGLLWHFFVVPPFDPEKTSEIFAKAGWSRADVEERLAKLRAETGSESVTEQDLASGLYTVLYRAEPIRSSLHAPYAIAGVSFGWIFHTMIQRNRLGPIQKFLFGATLAAMAIDVLTDGESVDKRTKLAAWAYGHLHYVLYLMSSAVAAASIAM